MREIPRFSEPGVDSEKNVAKDRYKDLKDLLDTLPDEVSENIQKILTKQIKSVISSMRIEKSGGTMKIGKIITGPWRARGVRVEKLKLGMKSEGLALEKSKIDLHLDVGLGFQFPSLRLSDPKIYKVGPAPGVVSTPMVKKLDLSSLTRHMGISFVFSAIETDKVIMDVAPVSEVDAGSGEVNDVTVDEITLQNEASSLAGFKLDGLNLRRLELASGEARKVRISRLLGADDLHSSDIIIRGITLSDSKVGSVQGSDLDLDFEIQLPSLKIKSFPNMPAMIERVITRFWVEITPRLVVHIGNLDLDGLSLTAETGEIRIKHLAIPFEFVDIEAEDIGVSGIEASGIGMDEHHVGEEQNK